MKIMSILAQNLLEMHFLDTKIANLNTNIYSHLEQSSVDKISFMNENDESSKRTSFLEKLKAPYIAN